VSVVRSERSGAVAVLTLDRPDSMNAINAAMRDELPACLLQADADDLVRAIVLRGAGERGFCAGADVKEFAPATDPHAYRAARLYGHWIGAFERVRKPIIAAIHGFCLGGGLEIALACDIRIAADDARFALPELTHGIIPGAGGTQRLLRLLGPGRAMDLILTGERLDAAEALRIGLVTRLVARAELDAAALLLAERIAAQPPLAALAAKEALQRGADLDLRAGMRLELDLLTSLLNTADRAEAVAAFRAKRTPQFEGR
jgi:enoyl-CoA hydratase/carnithine racemase